MKKGPEESWDKGLWTKEFIVADCESGSGLGWEDEIEAAVLVQVGHQRTWKDMGHLPLSLSLSAPILCWMLESELKEGVRINSLISGPGPTSLAERHEKCMPLPFFLVPYTFRFARNESGSRNSEGLLSDFQYAVTLYPWVCTSASFSLSINEMNFERSLLTDVGSSDSHLILVKDWGMD